MNRQKPLGALALLWALVLLLSGAGCFLVPPAATRTTISEYASSQSKSSAAQDEISRAVNVMWANVNDIDEVGAKVELIFFTSNGGMTLTSVKRTAIGSGAAPATSESDFNNIFTKFLPGFVGTHTRFIRLTLERAQVGWQVDAYDTPTVAGPSPPPEAHTTALPGSSGWSADSYSKSLALIQKIIPVMTATVGGTHTMSFDVTYEDGNPTNLAMGANTWTNNKGSQVDAAKPGTLNTLGNTILSFAGGIGDRIVKFKWEGKVVAGATRWHLASAATDRGPLPPVPDEATAIESAYRRMHLENFERTKQVMATAGEIAGFTVEQVAMWMIGGVLIRGTGALLRAAAPRVATAIKSLGAGGKIGGSEYVQTMLVRLAPAERAEIGALAAKMDAQGLDALSVAERSRLNALWAKLEGLFDAAVSGTEKDTLRKAMTARFTGTARGAAAEAAFTAAARRRELHHRLPLEWAHKLPGTDPNSGANLIALERTVHQSGVSPVWSRLHYAVSKGTVADARIDKAVVEEMAQIVDRNFSKWYDKVPASSEAVLKAEAQAAKDAALVEVDKLIARLSATP